MNTKKIVFDSTVGVALLLSLLGVAIFDLTRVTTPESCEDVPDPGDLLHPPTLNKFGNPEGKGLGLARPGEFQGYRLLAWSTENEIQENVFTADNPVWAALKADGFSVRLEHGPLRPEWLRDADQLWIFAGRDGLKAEDESAVVSFVAAGNGLYLLADNDPYLAEANQLARRLFDTTVTGNYAGQNLIAVRLVMA